MRKEQFVNGHYYHVFNRGVDRRILFLDRYDYERFYESIYLFNDSNYRHEGGRITRKLDRLARLLETGLDRKPLVRIVAYCFLPNHFHVFLEQLQENGIQTFFHRLQMGYAHYFNLRHRRSGGLFENPFQAVLIEDEAHFQHLSRYIHLNALDTSPIKWREGEVTDWNIAEDALDRYPWSSHHVYLGHDEEYPVVDREIVTRLFSSPDDYLKFLKGWSGRFVFGRPAS